MLVSGWLSVNFNWQSIFYVFGVAGILWSAVWFFVVKETPADDLSMSKNEKNFIKKSLERHGKVDVVKPPWRAIFTSMPVKRSQLHTSRTPGATTPWSPNFRRTWRTFSTLTFRRAVSFPPFPSWHYRCCCSCRVIWPIGSKSKTISQWRRSVNAKQFKANSKNRLQTGSKVFQQPFVLRPNDFPASRRLLHQHHGDHFLHNVIGGTGSVLNFRVLGESTGHRATIREHHRRVFQHFRDSSGLDFSGHYRLHCINTGEKHLREISKPKFDSEIFFKFFQNEHEYKIIFFISSGIYLIGIFFYAIFATGKLQLWAEKSTEASTRSSVTSKI